MHVIGTGPAPRGAHSVFAPGLASGFAAALAVWRARRGERGVVACRPSYLSPLAWLGLQLGALWPHGVWMARRAQDGSDDALGLAALAVLALLLWRMAQRLRVAPRTGALAVAAALTLAANAALPLLAPLACALLAALALCAGLWAWLPAGAPRAPLAGLLVLALPLLASLQYYGGYPLRVLTAQASAWALQLVGVAAERAGASMLVRGQLVIVDAPCSGVQMVWMAYFCACAIAALAPLRDAVFVRRLPWVGALVLLGNVLRNTVLVALESRPQGLQPQLHQAIGLLVLAAVCTAVLALMHAARRDPGPHAGCPPAPGASAPRPNREHPVWQRWWMRHWPAAAAVALATGALLPLARAAVPAQADRARHVEWPQSWDGRALRPLAMSAVEQRFAARFPGAIGRFTDGERVLVLRSVQRPTRMLHPATDCWRGLGYRVQDERLQRDAQQRLWRCFEAVARDGERYRVCERIEAPDGSAFIDPSSWFWAASLGRSSGPWQAVTVVEAL